MRNDKSLPLAKGLRGQFIFINDGTDFCFVTVGDRVERIAGFDSVDRFNNARAFDFVNR